MPAVLFFTKTYHIFLSFILIHKAVNLGNKKIRLYMGMDYRDYNYSSGGSRFSMFPPVIKSLLIINAVIFFLNMIADNISIGGDSLGNYIVLNFGLLPYDSSWFKIWQLITYQFLHDTSGFGHIFWNMFLLWMFGAEVENMWGSKKFLIYYLTCGVGAGITQLVFSSSTTIGASGSIYGIMVAFAMMFPNRLIYVYFLIPVRAKFLILGLVVVEFFALGRPSLVAHLAHIGGAVTGFVMMLMNYSNIAGVGNIFKQSRPGGNPFNKKETFNFRKPFGNPDKSKDVTEAKFYDISDSNTPDSDEITQEDIDRILDKISQSGYQNLSEKEKKILFEASKRK